NPDEYLNNIIKNKMQSLPQAHSQDELNSNVHGILKQLQNDHSKVKKFLTMIKLNTRKSRRNQRINRFS
ncbi:MAG: hypothetical protein LBP22_06645, partial [Deltaproteobacteria bacterium]|nr:hypothetical protein [Deltaproteobacteria bacterium]